MVRVRRKGYGGKIIEEGSQAKLTTKTGEE